MEISGNGLKLIIKYEGFSAKAYLCPAGIPTIGYGTITYPDGTKVKLGDVCTVEQAESWLRDYVEKKSIPTIEKLVNVLLNQNQIDALISFIYNLGSGAFSKSTLLKKINSKDFAGAALEFKKWDFANGKRLKGLTLRREAESLLFQGNI